MIQLVRVVIGAAGFAIVIVLSLEGLELLLHGFPWASRFLSEHRPAPSSYASIMMTIAQIEGVFLGLYFTGLSMVVSTTYSDVEAALRTEMLNEHVGNFYVKLLALSASGALLLAAATSAGGIAGVVNFSVFVGLAILSVLGFLPLGRRIFGFLDPEVLTTTLAERIIRFSRSATPEGLYWADRSFQASYRRQVEHAVSTFGAIAQLAGKSAGPSHSLLTLGLRCLQVMRHYSAIKQRIPHLSLWYRPRYRHGSWLTADHSQLELALATASPMQPKEEPDYNWLENDLFRIVESVLKTLHKRSDLESLQTLFGAIGDTIRTMAERLQTDEAVLLQKRMVEVCVTMPMASMTRHDADADLALRAATYSSRATMAAQAIGLGEGCRALATPELISSLESAARRPAPASVEVTVPRRVTTALSNLRDQLLFEKHVEHEEITPSWYIRDYLAAHLTQSLNSSSKDVVRLLSKCFADATAEISNTTAALTVIQIGLETCNKLVSHLGSVQGAMQDLAEMRWAFSEQRWPDYDLESELKQVNEVRNDLLIRLAKLTTRLPVAAPTGDLPDDFGYAVTTLSQACFEALLHEDSRLFNNIFRAYFVCGLVAAERVKRELADHPLETRLTLWADLVIDLLEITGYALVFHEISGVQVLGEVFGTWRRYISAQDDPKHLSNMTSGVLNYQRRNYKLSTRGVNRTSWGQAFARQMRERLLLSESLYSHGADAPVRAVSPIARAFITTCEVGTDAADVFEAVVHEQLFGCAPDLSGGADSYLQTLKKECKASRVEVEDYVKRVVPQVGDGS